MPAASVERKPTIFVSHSSADAAIAEVLRQLIEGAIPGARVFTGNNSIPSGDRWQAEMYNQLRNAAFIVVIVTPASLSSSWAPYEVGIAKGLEKRFYPITFGVEPTQVSGPLQQYQISRGDSRDDMERLLRHWAQELKIEPSRLWAHAITDYIERIQDVPHPRSQAFDVFLSYRADDEGIVRELASRLERDGIRTWLDYARLNAGDVLGRRTAEAINHAPAMAILIGRSGIGGMQAEEMAIALRRKFTELDDFRLIPVILPDAGRESVPSELLQYEWVTFRNELDTGAYELLKKAIRPDIPVKAPKTSLPKPTLTDDDARMLCQLLFRLVTRFRERPEMLQSLDATSFWAAVRKFRSDASTLEDLRAISAELTQEPEPGALWAAWVRNVRRVELAALLQAPDIHPVSQ